MPGTQSVRGRDGTGVYEYQCTPGGEKYQGESGEKVNHDTLEQALSLERFGRYVAWAAGDRDRAVALYTLNTQLSECLYTPLQTLEVALRNRIHAVLIDARHEAWFHDEGFLLGSYQPEQLAKAIADVESGGKKATPGRTVAALTFSFWTGMFGADYETLWQQTLHRIADPSAPKGLKRKSFSGPLTQIRLLRNRVAHHEPIIMWNLGKHHAKMLELTAWLSPAAAEWCSQNDRFDEVYPAERIVLAAGVPEEESDVSAVPASANEPGSLPPDAAAGAAVEDVSSG